MASLIGEIKVFEGETSQRSSYCRYPVVELRVRMHRRASFYVFSVWLPNFLIVTLAFLVLTIEKKNVSTIEKDDVSVSENSENSVSDRVGLIVTLLLTSIGYRTSIELPRTSTLSWLDAYLLACIAALVTLAVFALNAKITITSWRAVSQLGLPLLGLIVVQLLGLICLDLVCRRKPDGAVERKRRSTVALTTAIFVALGAVLGAVFIGTPTPNNELLKSLVEICFLIWLLLNLEFFMLFFFRSPLLQPSIKCAPDPRESLIAVPIAKLAAAATHGLHQNVPGTSASGSKPARAATSPARDQHLHRVAFSTSTRSTQRSATPSSQPLPREYSHLLRRGSSMSENSVSSVDSERGRRWRRDGG
jgi:hypothetical protein